MQISREPTRVWRIFSLCFCDGVCGFYNDFWQTAKLRRDEIIAPLIDVFSRSNGTGRSEKHGEFYEVPQRSMSCFSSFFVRQSHDHSFTYDFACDQTRDYKTRRFKPQVVTCFIALARAPEWIPPPPQTHHMTWPISLSASITLGRHYFLRRVAFLCYVDTSCVVRLRAFLRFLVYFSWCVMRNIHPTN